MLFADVRLICFDVDDTLWDFSAMMHRGTTAVATRIAERFGNAYAHMSHDFLTDAQHKYIERQDPQTINYIEARRVVFNQLFREHPEGKLIADDLVETYVAARNLRYEFFEDAISTLQTLKQRYRLGWITNGTTAPKDVGLADLFDVVVLPETLNLRKPKPEVFHHAAKLAGCSIQQMLHVGDNLITDVGGARWAGAHGAWYNPLRAKNDTKIQPTVEIQALQELLNLLP